MASVIAAGTTSGTSLNLSADTSGVLQLATNGTTTAVTIDTSQNVGIGTSSPARTLSVTSSSANIATFNGPANSNIDITDGTGTLRLQLLSSEPYIASLGAYAMRFATNNTERMRITSTGLVGIGTSSPNGAVTISTQLNALSGTGNTFGLHLYPAPSGVCYVDALTNSSSNSSLALRSYNNGTYHEVRLNQNGNLALPGGAGGVTGVGITFPATQSASSDANTLDDYEEGTWGSGAGITMDSGSVTLSGVSQTYTKIGRQVNVNFNATIASISSPSGAAYLPNLPFVAANSVGISFWAQLMASSATTSLQGRILSGEQRVRLSRFLAGAQTAMGADFIVGAEIAIQATYIV
jgi:hypothetical protein